MDRGIKEVMEIKSKVCCRDGNPLSTWQHKTRNESFALPCRYPYRENADFKVHSAALVDKIVFVCILVLSILAVIHWHSWFLMVEGRQGPIHLVRRPPVWQPDLKPGSLQHIKLLYSVATKTKAAGV